MTPARLVDAGHGIQNEVPFGWQQIQPDLQSVARVYDHGT